MYMSIETDNIAGEEKGRAFGGYNGPHFTIKFVFLTDTNRAHPGCRDFLCHTALLSFRIVITMTTGVTYSANVSRTRTWIRTAISPRHCHSLQTPTTRRCCLSNKAT